MSTVVLAGASGDLGREVMARLRARGLVVRALTRRAAKIRGADEVFEAAAVRPGALAGLCRGASAVVSCLGASVRLRLSDGRATYSRVDVPANLALMQEAAAQGVRDFTYVSVYGAREDDPLDYLRSHARVERAMKEQGFASRVIRPTGLFSAFTPFLTMARSGAACLIGDGSARTNPVHEGDVADAVVTAMSGGPQTIELGGPEVLTRLEIAQLAFEVLTKAPRVYSSPAFTTGIAAALARPLCPRLADLLLFARHVMTHDVIAPQTGTRRLEEYFRNLATLQA
jgi:uncharacterized protein YbjT (DUF2867 family)